MPYSIKANVLLKKKRYFDVRNLLVCFCREISSFPQFEAELKVNYKICKIVGKT